MEGERLFTQSDRHVALGRRRLFGFAGALPVLLLTALLTWFGAIGSAWTGIGFRQVAFAVPGVLAIQLVLLTLRLRQPERLYLRLSSDCLEMTGNPDPLRFPLDSLEWMRVVRRNGEVRRLVLRFPGRTLRLVGFLGMDTLRDLLVRYAGTQKDSRVRIVDPGHRAERDDVPLTRSRF